MDGDPLDLWIHDLIAYFKTCLDIFDATKLQIIGLWLEGVAQTWWETQSNSSKVFIELNTNNLRNDIDYVMI